MSLFEGIAAVLGDVWVEGGCWSRWCSLRVVELQIRGGVRIEVLAFGTRLLTLPEVDVCMRNFQDGNSSESSSLHRTTAQATAHPLTHRQASSRHRLRVLREISHRQRGRHFAEPLTTTLRSTHIEDDSHGIYSTAAAARLATATSTRSTARSII